VSKFLIQYQAKGYYYMKHIVGFYWLLVMITVQGCATIGSQFQFHGVDSITIGKTTKHDILSKYGKPLRVGYENGNEKWSYGYYHYRAFGNSNTKDLSVTFSHHGVVSNYTYSSSEPSEVNKVNSP
jgi:hypothetical protein